jgi:hypothetical protein
LDRARPDSGGDQAAGIAKRVIDPNEEPSLKAYGDTWISPLRTLMDPEMVGRH